MSEKMPYLAIGNNELGEVIGKTITCPICGKLHPVEYGDEIRPDGTKVPSKLLAFFRCGGKVYLAGVNGRSIIVQNKGENQMMREEREAYERARFDEACEKEVGI